MNREKQITKGSHWLPRTYLKHFFVGNKLFMYKKGKEFFKKGLNQKQRIIEVLGHRGLDSIAKENYFYRIEAKDIDPNFVENLFREIVEDDLDKIIQEVKNKDIGDKIDKELKKKLCLFIATMRVRTPLFKWEMAEALDVFFKMGIKLQAELSQKLLTKTEKEQLRRDYSKLKGRPITNKEVDKEIKQANEKIRKGDLRGIKVFDSSNKFFLKTALSHIEPSAKIFFGMKMNILKSGKGENFITSDNPVVYFVPKDKADGFYNNYKNLMSRYVELFFPLTKNLGIHLSRDERFTEMVMPALSLTGVNFVDIFNYNISHNSKDFIFSPIKLSSLDKFIKKYIPYPFKLVSSGLKT